MYATVITRVNMAVVKLQITYANY